jgi:hypothetical protein
VGKQAKDHAMANQQQSRGGVPQQDSDRQPGLASKQ